MTSTLPATWSLPSNRNNLKNGAYRTSLTRQGGIRRRPVRNGYIDKCQMRRSSQQPFDRWRCRMGSLKRWRMVDDQLSAELETEVSEKELSIATTTISHDDKSQAIGRSLRNWNAVTIQETGNNCGRGVYANVDFEKGHRIIVEKPILSCIHWMLRNGRRTVTEDWMKLPLEKQQTITSYFTRLSNIPVGAPLTSQHKKQLEKFIEEYGFWDPQRARAHIYLLVSHINHACISCANAEQWTDSEWPHRINIKLVKPVQAGEELFINYNRKTPFGCAVCGPPRLRDRLKDFACGLFG